MWLSEAGGVGGGGQVDGEGGALGGDLLGRGWGERGPEDAEGEAKPDGDGDLGVEAQRRAPPALAQEGGGVADRATGHQHEARQWVGGARLLVEEDGQRQLVAALAENKERGKGRWWVVGTGERRVRGLRSLRRVEKGKG